MLQFLSLDVMKDPFGIVGHSQMSTTDAYNRRAGIGLEGATDQLAYEIPTFNDSQVVSMSKFRRT